MSGLMAGIRIGAAAGLTLLSTVSLSEAQATDSLSAGWFLNAGATQISVDLEDPARELGASVGAGIMYSGAAAVASVAHWPRAGVFSFTALHLELRYPVARGTKLGLFLATTFGYTWANYEGPTGPNITVGDPDGGSSAYGLGVEVAPRKRLGAEVEFRLRSDGGTWNGELRLQAAMRGAPSVLKEGSGSNVSLHTVWMVPLRGPWDFVEPGYSLRVERPVKEGFNIGASIAVFHWQIPGLRMVGDYLWDTRAFVAYPAVSFRPAADIPAWFRVGPAIIAMGEGPDSGTTIGPQVELAPRFRLFGVGVEGSFGWLWMPRGDETSPEDQHGLMVGVGFRF